MIDSYDFNVSILICHECGEASEAWHQNIRVVGNHSSVLEVELECPSCGRYIGHNETIDIQRNNHDLADEVEDLAGEIYNVNSDDELKDIHNSLYDVAARLR